MTYLAGVFLPHSCLLCQKFSQTLLCQRCDETMTLKVSDCEPPQGLDACWVLSEYQGTMKQLLWKLKFEDWPGIADVLGQKIIAAMHDQPMDYDSVMTVPSHWWRVMKRGFEHVNAVFKRPAQAFHWPMQDAMKLRRYTKALFELDAAQRQAVLRHAFALREGADLSGKRVLLLDDIITTGSTLSAIADLCREHGASKVDALCVARVQK